MRSTVISSSKLVLGAAVGLLALIACGPRLKPVEYQEPTSSGSSDDMMDEDMSSSSASAGSSNASESSGEDQGDSSASTFSPCQGKRCGARCTECNPTDDSCMEVLVMKQCSSEGKCVPAPAVCEQPKKGKKDKKGK